MEVTVAHHTHTHTFKTPSTWRAFQTTLRCFASLSARGYLSISSSICPCLPQSAYGLVFAHLYHSFNQSVLTLKPSLFVLFHITPFVFTSSIHLPCPHIHLINLFSCPPSVHLRSFSLFSLFFYPSTIPLFGEFTCALMRG